MENNDKQLFNLFIQSSFFNSKGVQWLQKLCESLNVVYVFTVPTTHYFEITQAVLVAYFGSKEKKRE